MIIGLHALDLVPKKAAGTAAGFTGFFGYVFGSAIAGSGVGWIADRWGWNGVFVAMVACCILTIVFSAMTLGHKAESAARGYSHREIWNLEFGIRSRIPNSEFLIPNSIV